MFPDCFHWKGIGGNDLHQKMLSFQPPDEILSVNAEVVFLAKA